VVIPDLSGKVCVVTGASRGVGRGLALGLLDAGATVHITGRTLHDGEHPSGLDRAGSLTSVLEAANSAPGKCIAHRVDHARDEETEAILRQVIEAEGRIDILVNNAWPGYERMVEGETFTWVAPFWEQPMWRWDAMIDTGVRAAYCASRIAAATMVRQRQGLIVNISFWAAQKFMQNTVYGIAKAAMDKMVADFAVELRVHEVAAVALYPGPVRTEEVMKNAQFFDMSNSESPQFQGRAVAALFADPMLMARSGTVVTSAGLGLDYGFTDIDGRQPVPLTVATA
jgi:dehydrogenase/reductase SDR family protein 1